jgi:enamine deaminase RidA (YjgF/YER057c/UK114 family)
MAPSRIYSACLAALLLAVPALIAAKKKKDPNEFPQVVQSKKKEKPEQTQVLPPVKEPPRAVIAEIGRLNFVVTPLSDKGLLTQQTREALRWLLSGNRGNVVKLRAFVAGTGDVRRVQDIVSETFTDKKLQLPALSVAQVGALPLEAAQVVIEATIEDRQVINPNGVAFVSAQRGTPQDPTGPMQLALREAEVEPANVRRVTCFVSSLAYVTKAREQVARTYPEAAADFVQVLRGPLEEFVECEAVGAVAKAPPEGVSFLNPQAGMFSEVAIVAPMKIAITGTQLGFQSQDADLRLAFDRLGKTLDSVGASYKRLVFAHVYTLVRTTGEKVNKLRYDYHGKQIAPAGTSMLFEGLPGLDASFGIDVIAAL